MIFKKGESRIILRVVLLFAFLCTASYVIVVGEHFLLVLLLPIILYLLIAIIRIQQKTQKELEQFVKSIQYRDFSVFYDTKHAPAELQTFRKGLNEINTTFRTISRERETQYHYLQKILELVNTGILSYEPESGEVIWMNESLKTLLQLPYLKSIHSLKKRDAELYAEILSLPPGQTKIATAHVDKTPFKVLLSATAFQTEGRKYKLLAFQNVHDALDETESRAWQKLLSVMTHEIMNSVAPISSLADTLKNRLQSTLTKETPSEDFEDLEAGFSAIKRRSEGLLKFAETYRNLNKITKLNLKQVYIKEVFANLYRLMQPTMAQKNITLEIKLDEPEICLQADANLLDQVLINLLVNAIEATKDRPEAKISLSAYMGPNNKTIIKVADNGTGMSKEVQEKIFIPFFSTKKNGSGIGLSLCKQIVMLHRGTIQIQSNEGQGTAFLLRFG